MSISCFFRLLEIRVICFFAPFFKLSHLIWFSRYILGYRAEHEHGTNIQRLSKHLVLKTGQTIGVRSAEISAMRFVHSHTRIPIPTVFASWTTATTTAARDNGNTCTIAFIMEWIDHDASLEDKWPTLSINDKYCIMRQLTAFVNQLRAIPQPTPIRGMVCATDGSACVVLDSRTGTNKPIGPFSSERSFNTCRLSMLVAPQKVFYPGSDTRKTVEKLRSQLLSPNEDHRIVLTHGNMSARNVLLDSDNDIVALVDWELAGWFPEHWEWLKLIHGKSHDEEWLSFAREITGGEILSKN